jgi:hypothetical protein
MIAPVAANSFYAALTGDKSFLLLDQKHSNPARPRSRFAIGGVVEGVRMRPSMLRHGNGRHIGQRRNSVATITPLSSRLSSRPSSLPTPQPPHGLDQGRLTIHWIRRGLPRLLPSMITSAEARIPCFRALRRPTLIFFGSGTSRRPNVHSPAREPMECCKMASNPGIPLMPS